MSSLLFRQQALEARGSQGTGAILLMRPVPMQVAALVSVALTIVLALYLCLGDYTRKVRVTGQLVPAAGALRIVAPQFGRIVARHVRDGDMVAAGQLLYELSSERTGGDGNIDNRIDAALAARRDLLTQERELQARQLQHRAKSLRERQQLLSAEAARLDQEILLQ